jgi:hypothetical protein
MSTESLLVLILNDLDVDFFPLEVGITKLLVEKGDVSGFVNIEALVAKVPSALVSPRPHSSGPITKNADELLNLNVHLWSEGWKVSDTLVPPLLNLGMVLDNPAHDAVVVEPKLVLRDGDDIMLCAISGLLSVKGADVLPS